MIKSNQTVVRWSLSCGLLYGAFFTCNSAWAYTPITACGQNLSVPGEYVLQKNLVCPDTGSDVNGIVVSASNVKVHMAGRSLSAAICDLSRNVSGIYIKGGLTGVTVDGGKITGFNDGVVLSSSNSRVFGMTIKKACAFGIVGQGENNTIDSNQVSESGDGVALVPAYHAVVTGNTLTGNIRAGVAISDFADSNLIEKNVLSRNGTAGEGYGVAVINGHGNTIRRNAINDNDFGVRIGSAVYRDGTIGLPNIITGNTINSNDKGGIWLEAVYGAPSQVKSNIVFGSVKPATDMQDDRVGCGGNVWQYNDFVTDQVAGVGDGGPATGCIR